jgi:hypothetical protein
MMLRRDFIMTAIASAVGSIFPVQQSRWESAVDALSRIREKKINATEFGFYENVRFIESQKIGW